MVLSVQDVVRGMSLPPGYNHEALEQLANMADAYEVKIEDLRAKLSAAIVAIEFAHSEGFEWPTDPMAVIAAARPDGSPIAPGA